MNFLLDSNAFSSRELMKALKEHENGEIFINVIVDLEKRFYYLLKQKLPLWNSLLDQLQITVLPISDIESSLAASFAQNFKSHPKGPSYFFRDCLVGASAVRHQLILITDNLKDFQYIAEDQIYSVENFLGNLES